MEVAPDMHQHGRELIDELIIAGPVAASAELGNLIRKHRRPNAATWTKSELLSVLEAFYQGDANYSWLKKVLTKRPIRSLSGITSITVLTKPYPCPGRCVFCPVDVRMPKSYIATEPGAQRAGRLGFDPYQQVTQRLRAYWETGHPISKIEFIVLGGTWSSYPRPYQRWFLKRMFEALNDFGIRSNAATHAYFTDWDERIAEGESYNDHINASRFVTDAYVEEASQEELEEAHRLNETAGSRCVGLSLETRPDLLDEDEALHLRMLGATKIQIGIQSMDDRVLRLNKRGHLVAKTEAAIRTLRQFGFKIHAHWMPNLHGSTPEADKADYDKVFSNPSIRPDELKVYPTVLIQDTELERIAAEGKWQAYAEEELNGVLQHVLTHTPEYARLTRIIRDIPSHEILAGNKKGNFRQIVEEGIAVSAMSDIRAREIKGTAVASEDLVLDRQTYETTDTTEHFFQFIRPDDRKIAAFLRLSLPKPDVISPLPELEGRAIIREVHVYGQSVMVGGAEDAAQHRGLGTQLVNQACDLARQEGFGDVAIISAVGTRKYYEKLGFVSGELYQHRSV